MTAIPINEKIPIIKGLNINNQQLNEAEKNNKMLLIDIETSNICNLNCQYCFRDVYGGHIALKQELPLEKRLELIRQAKSIGCETIKITGAGEPFADKNIWPMIELSNQLGMWVLIFTNGSLITKEVAERLYKMNVSLIVKANSFDEQKEDKMVGRKGYAKIRNNVFDILFEMGFNKTIPTRLGRDLVIASINKEEVYDSLRWCRKNNVFPLFRPLMPIGAAKNLKDWMIPKEEIKQMYEKVREIDSKEFGLSYNLTLPYMGGIWCRQLHYAIYVNILGEAYACTGSKKLLGNFKEQSLAEVWSCKEAKRIRDTPYESCPLRESYWRGDKEYDCII
ncbi:radical SAM protein [Candidatus Woesearchaeota archaeon]|nr:radical SAM protein [Candidatus Woesearchaeota archaeon]